MGLHPYGGALPNWTEAGTGAWVGMWSESQKGTTRKMEMASTEHSSWPFMDSVLRATQEASPHGLQWHRCTGERVIPHSFFAFKYFPGCRKRFGERLNLWFFFPFSINILRDVPLHPSTSSSSLLSYPPSTLLFLNPVFAPPPFFHSLPSSILPSLSPSPSFPPFLPLFVQPHELNPHHLVLPSQSPP